MICKHCKKPIFWNGVLWVDRGPIFPQYCYELSSVKHEPDAEKIVDTKT
jgi:hypothetical protein